MCKFQQIIHKLIALPLWSGAIVLILTLKVPITTEADDNFFFLFLEKCLEISCKLSAWQMIDIKCQDFFFLKKKKKKNLNVVCYKFCLAG